MLIIIIVDLRFCGDKQIVAQDQLEKLTIARNNALQANL